MISSVQTYVHLGKNRIRQWILNPTVQLYCRAAAYLLSGFILSAASLGNSAMPLVLGLVCSCTGWSAVLAAGGGCLGYWLFWGAAGEQSIAWVVLGLAVTVLLQDRRIVRETPLLFPAVAGLIVSAMGVLFQVWLADDTPVGIYMLRVALAGGSTWLFTKVLMGRHPILDWLACALAVLALAQIVPIPYVGLGFVAAGALAVLGAFPAAALAGVALDLAGITPVSMTAVLCISYLIRFLPRTAKSLQCAAPAIAYLLVMTLTEHRDLSPLPGLFLGGLAVLFLPSAGKVPARRGETGVAQVRLEMAAGALLQTQQLLLEVAEIPMDEDALVERAAEQACVTCPHRKSCKDSRRIAQLPAAILHKPLLTGDELPIICRKSGRFLAELHRAQEQLRSIRADRERQKEYRSAILQQYRFLAEYLQDLSDQLARKAETVQTCFEARVQVYGNRPEADNGDRCAMFSGIKSRYYVILCDGMGTGLGAVQEGQTALALLRKMLTAGYPAEHALQSLNSLCALRGRAGAVTVDLLELQLDTGRVQLFKWGAAPSYLLTEQSAEKIGTTGPPPGLSVDDPQAMTYRLSLRRGETLFLVSDGIGEEEALHLCAKMVSASPGDVAKALLNCSHLGGEDDATVITVQLDPGYAST